MLNHANIPQIQIVTSFKGVEATIDEGGGIN